MKRLLASTLVVVTACGRAEPPDPAARRRDAYVDNLLAREGLTDAALILSRADLIFEDGFTLPQFIDRRLTPSWLEVVRHTALAVPPQIRQGVPARWIGPLSHLRVYGSGSDMQLRMWGQVDVNILRIRPRLTATIDGREVHSQLSEPDGRFVIEARVPAASLNGWSDLYLELSSVQEPWRELSTLRVAWVEGVTWRPVR